MIGRKAHVARLRRLSGAGLDREVGKALFAGANIIQVEAQIGITSGSVSGKNHVPGPVGGYPNADTLVLANSIETDLRFEAEGPVAEVSANAPYAAHVHDGTSRMGARPFMSLARDAKRKTVADLVVKAVKRLAGRRGG